MKGAYASYPNCKFLGCEWVDLKGYAERYASPRMWAAWYQWEGIKLVMRLTSETRPLPFEGSVLIEELLSEICHSFMAIRIPALAQAGTIGKPKKGTPKARAQHDAGHIK